MSRRKSSKSKKLSARKGTGKTDASLAPAPPFSPLSRPALLHCEDEALWAAVTKGLTPLKETHDRLHFGPLLDEKPSLPRQWQSAAKKPQRGPEPSPQNMKSAGGSVFSRPVAPLRSVPDLGRFTRRDMRQIDSGRQSIEARLDLHGLRQSAAHIALKGFLVHAQGQGFRHVLVITGKGRSSQVDEMMFAEPEQGVLRRAVPLWLAEPDLRTIVAGFNQAPRRHGGEGALYVRLRRAR